MTKIEEFAAESIKQIEEYKKLLDAGELPSYNWIVESIFKKSDVGIFFGTQRHSIFQFYSQEYIAALANDIKKLKPKTIIEVGAGDGRLSFFLNKYWSVKGIPLKSTPTDDYSWGMHIESDSRHIVYPKEVEKLNFKEALKKYNPDVVIICWEELHAKYTQEILKFPSVRYVVWIGEGEGGCTGDPSTFALPYERLKNPFGLCRTDFMLGDDHRLLYHSGVYLFKGENNAGNQNNGLPKS
jgi:hypothetical protein